VNTADWLGLVKYVNELWGINTACFTVGINIAHFLVQAGVVCLPCGRFPQRFQKRATMKNLLGYLAAWLIFET
jgi:hypothetical protein